MRVSRQPAAEPDAHRIVMVASSAGGLAALLVILPDLPASFPAPVICVQHLAPHLPSYMAEILRRRCALEVGVADRPCRPIPGTVLVAPPDHHVVIEADGRLAPWDGPVVNHVRPSADVLFTSAAEVLGAAAIAVVLSGTGHDGAAGAASVHEAGGTVVVQSPSTCEFPAMVESTMALFCPDRVVPLHELAATLEEVVACR